MSRNLISNGNFETGNFAHWSVTENDGSAKVVMYKGSYKAEIRLGKHEAVMLDTGRFLAGPGAFHFSLQASMPKPQDEKEQTLIYCTLFGCGPSQATPIYILPVPFWLSQPEKHFEYQHSMKPGVNEVQLIIGLLPPPAPHAVGPIYIDNVKYNGDLPS